MKKMIRTAVLTALSVLTLGAFALAAYRASETAEEYLLETSISTPPKRERASATRSSCWAAA